MSEPSEMNDCGPDCPQCAVEGAYSPPAPPSSMRVLHLEFDIEFIDREHMEQLEKYAWCDKNRQKIVIERGLRPRMLADVVIHEILHAIHCATGAEQELSEEQIAMTFSGPLVCVLRDNPRLFDWLRYLVSVKQ